MISLYYILYNWTRWILITKPELDQIQIKFQQSKYIQWHLLGRGDQGESQQPRVCPGGWHPHRGKAGLRWSWEHSQAPQSKWVLESRWGRASGLGGVGGGGHWCWGKKGWKRIAGWVGRESGNRAWRQGKACLVQRKRQRRGPDRAKSLAQQGGWPLGEFSLPWREMKGPQRLRKALRQQKEPMQHSLSS